MSRIKVSWTAKHTDIENGQWIIEIDGKILDLSNNIDKSFGISHMNTFGHYFQITSQPCYMDVLEEYSDGLDLKEWSKRKKKIWKTIFDKNHLILDDVILKELFIQIQKNDWRPNSCP